MPGMEPSGAPGALAPGRGPRIARRPRLRWVALCAVVATVPVLHARRADDRLDRTVPLAPGQAIAVRVPHGRVRITGRAGRGDVHVVVERRAASPDLLASTAVALAADATGVRLDTAPGPAASSRAVTAEVTVEVPADATIDPVTLDEGRLDLTGLTGAVRAMVAQGPIRAADMAGVVRLETTIGSVVLTGARLVAGGLIRLRAFNGDIRLGFAAPPEDARIMALALNGTISSSVPLTTRNAWGPRWGEASIGAADRVVSLDVVTGTIHIDGAGGR